MLCRLTFWNRIDFTTNYCAICQSWRRMEKCNWNAVWRRPRSDRIFRESCVDPGSGQDSWSAVSPGSTVSWFENSQSSTPVLNETIDHQSRRTFAHFVTVYVFYILPNIEIVFSVVFKHRHSCKRILELLGIVSTIHSFYNQSTYFWLEFTWLTPTTITLS